MTFRFPESARLAVPPVMLRRLASRLQTELDTEVSCPPSIVDALRVRILKTPAKECRGLRLSAREQRALAILSGEVTRQTVQRIALVAMGQVTRANPRVLARLLANLVHLPAFRIEVARRWDGLRTASGPRWFHVHGQQLCSEELPGTDLAEKGHKLGLHLNDLISEMGLPSATVLTRLVVHRFVSQAPNEAVEAQAGDWLSGVRATRWEYAIIRTILARVFDVAQRQCQGTNALSECMIDWLETARQRCGGWPEAKLGAWAEMPDGAIEYARWYQTHKAIEAFFSGYADSERVRYWRRWTRHIVSFKRLDQAGAFMMQVGNRYLVEFQPIGACYSYDRKQWAYLLSRRRKRAGDLKLAAVQGSEHWLAHHRGWQQRFDRYLRTHAGV